MLANRFSKKNELNDVNEIVHTEKLHLELPF